MKCAIQWVDDNGKPTPDTNTATCIAVSIQTYADKTASIRAFPCCSKHEHQLDALVRKHLTKSLVGQSTSRWVKVDLTVEEID